MKKNFLLLLLLTLLPFSAWAVNYGQIRVTWNNPAAGTYNAADQALPNILSVAQYNSFGWQTLPTSAYTIEWTYSGSDVVVARNAGTYTATITPTSGNSFTAASGNSLTHTWTMNRANNNVSAPSFPDGNSWEYLQSPNDPSSTALDGTVTYQWYNGSSWTDWPVPASQKPGTYSIRALVAQTLNYNADQSTQSTFVVTKAKVYITPNNETAEWRDPWNGKSMDDITPTVTGAQNWSDAKSYLEWNQVTPRGDAGASYEYTLQPNAAGTANEYYEYVVASSANVSIIKNTTGALSAGVDGADLTYNGEEQTLEPGAVPTFTDSNGNEAGTIEYSLNGTDWSTEYPKGKDAQVYTVQFRGIGDQNHEDETVGGSYNVEILPYELVAGTDFDAPTAKTDGVYTEDPVLTPKPQDIAIAGAFKGKFAEELTTKGAQFIYPTSADLPQEANAGTYSFDWDIDVTTATNFTYTAGPITVNGAEIAKADLTPVAAADANDVVEGLQYKAADQKLLKGEFPLPEFMDQGRSGTFEYFVDGVSVGNDWNDVVGKDADVDADAYVITYTFTPTSGNFNPITTEQSVGNANIAKADLTVSGVAAKENVVYNGSAQSILKHGADVETSYHAILAASEYSVSYEGGETSPVNAYANVKQTHA
ncbi:MAG: hypothetical protein IJT28_02050, partial [Bacteroidaceae bacterium]|nr:hypothetical protein [Bacteroidaceae bacterium]